MLRTLYLQVLGALLEYAGYPLLVALVKINHQFRNQPYLTHPVVILLILALAPTIPFLRGIPDTQRVSRGLAISGGCLGLFSVVWLCSWFLEVNFPPYYYVLVAVIWTVAVTQSFLFKGVGVVALASCAPQWVTLGHSLYGVVVPVFFLLCSIREAPFYDHATDTSMFVYLFAIPAVMFGLFAWLYPQWDKLVTTGDDIDLYTVPEPISQDVESVVTDKYPMGDLPSDVIMSLGAVAGTHLVSALVPYITVTVFPLGGNTHHYWFTAVAWLLFAFGNFAAHFGFVHFPRRAIITNFDHLRMYVFIRVIFWVLLCGCNIKGAGPWFGGNQYYLSLMVLFGWSHGQCMSSALAKLHDNSHTDRQRQTIGVYLERMVTSGRVAGYISSLLVLWYFDITIHQR